MKDGRWGGMMFCCRSRRMRNENDDDNPRRRSTPTAVALYVNASVLLAILVALLARNESPAMLPAAYGQTQLPIAGGAGVFVMPAQFAPNIWGCYLLDVDAQTLCAYQYVEGMKQMRLVAARHYAYDRRLKEFNTDSRRRTRCGKWS